MRRLGRGKISGKRTHQRQTFSEPGQGTLLPWRSMFGKAFWLSEAIAPLESTIAESKWRTSTKSEPRFGEAKLECPRESPARSEV